MSDERDDQEFRRITGKNVNGAIYFLPWRTNFQTALTFGLVGLEDWWLCYELPTDVVAAEPRRCAAAIRSLIDDAASQIERHGLPTVFVGLSMGVGAGNVSGGTVPPTPLELCVRRSG